MAEEQKDARLDSWKEIAEYLKRDVRTAIRWHDERGMPVHRVPGGRGQSRVFAYTAELSAWLNGKAGDGRQAAGGEPGSTGQQEAAGWGQETRGRARQRRWLIGASAVTVFLAVSGLLAYHWTRAGEPARVTLAGRVLRVWDERDRLAWEYQFPQPMKLPDDEPRRPVQIADINADGHLEVLVAPMAPDTRDGSDELYCFSAKGTLLWLHQPRLTLTSPYRRYEDPWHIVDLLVTSGSAPSHIWVSWGQQDRWPGLLVSVDSNGQATVRFINGGALYSLNRLQTATGSYILAGGVNNEYSMGMLAVLKEDQPPASSPQTPGSRYTCEECPPGRPFQYFLFPRSEVNRVNGLPYNGVELIRILNHGVEVHTSEQPPGLFSRAIWELSADFNIRAAIWASNYPDLHRRYEREGRIDHPYEKCPERAGPSKARVWDAEHGWHDLPVPQPARHQ